MLVLLTEIGHIVIHRTVQPIGTQIAECVRRRSTIHTIALGHHIHLIENVVDGSGRLMNGTDNRATLACQIVQQLNTVCRR